MREISYACRPKPVRKPGECLVKVHAASINPIDWKTRSGAAVPSFLIAKPKVGWARQLVKAPVNAHAFIIRLHCRCCWSSSHKTDAAPGMLDGICNVLSPCHLSL